jgi:hypothetical protein
VQQWLAGGEAADLIRDHLGAPQQRLVRGTSEVRGEYDVVVAEQRVDLESFLLKWVKDIQGGAGQAAGREGLVQRGLVDERLPRGVDEARPGHDLDAPGVLPMSSAFEAVALLLSDLLATRVRQSRGESVERMRSRHTNLE